MITLSILPQLNVNDIFLAIAKKLPKDGEGGAGGAGAGTRSVVFISPFGAIIAISVVTTTAITTFVVG